MIEMEYDVFISHASEDKADIARPLAVHLQSLGLSVWFDEFELRLGDSLRRNIDRGLSQSKFGVVILSPTFFLKEWTKKELDGLVAREDGRDKVILPIWHNINAEDVRKYSPILADKLSVSTSLGLDSVAKRIIEVICPKEVKVITDRITDDVLKVLVGLSSQIRGTDACCAYFPFVASSQSWGKIDKKTCETAIAKLFAYGLISHDDAMGYNVLEERESIYPVLKITQEGWRILKQIDFTINPKG